MMRESGEPFCICQHLEIVLFHKFRIGLNLKPLSFSAYSAADFGFDLLRVSAPPWWILVFGCGSATLHSLLAVRSLR
jgi:hypothetical protein